MIGRKGVGYYTFRQKPIQESWTGFSEKPTYADAERAADSVLPAFDASSDGETADGVQGIDEIHLVSTHFVSMITQTAQARRMAPLEVEYVEHDTQGGTELLPVVRVRTRRPSSCSTRCCRST